MLLSKAARSCRYNSYILPLVAYFILYQYCRLNFYADPTSYFFNPAKAFAPGYSAQRQEEASAFLEHTPNFPFRRRHQETNPKICIGITTIAREGANYLHLSIGSVLHGLTSEERQQVELKILIAHTDPTRHPNWNSTWLRNVVDEVLDYGPEFGNQSYIQEIEGHVDKENTKSLFDYTYMLQSCKASGAAHIMMLEDDTVSAQGWYGRVLEGLESIKTKMIRMGHDPNSCKYPSYRPHPPVKYSSQLPGCSLQLHSPLPSPLLHREIPRLELRIQRPLHNPLPPDHHPPTSSHPSSRLITAETRPTNGNYPPLLPHIYPHVDSTLLRLRPPLHSPCLPRCASNAEIRLLHTRDGISCSRG